MRKDRGIPDVKLLSDVALGEAVGDASTSNVVGLQQRLRMEQRVIELAGDGTHRATKDVTFAFPLERAFDDVSGSSQLGVKVAVRMSGASLG